MTRLITSLLSILIIFSATSQDVKAEELSAAQKAEVQKIVESYIQENGEKILESVNSYHAKLEEESRKEASAKAKTFMEELEGRKNLTMTGNPKGDVTLVEFFDYNCGYCRKALEEIQIVLKDDKGLKVVFLDMPILGPPSVEAAKWSLAANNQGKYFEYHQALLEHNGQKDEASLTKLAKDVGLDVEKLKKDKDSKDIQEMIDGQVLQAQALGIRGTPGFILDGEIYPGFLPAEQIKSIIADARKK